jgi:hypothetical protein
VSLVLPIKSCHIAHGDQVLGKDIFTSLPGALLLDKEGGGVPTRPSPMLVKMEERMLVLRCPGMSGMSLGVRLPTLGPMFMLGGVDFGSRQSDTGTGQAGSTR